MNKKQYTHKTANLFTEWKDLKHHKNKSFVTDGIVEFSKWNNSQKILIILKEAYGGEWNLADIIDDREWIKSNPHYRMLSMWLYILNNTTVDNRPKIKSDEQLNEAFQYLLSSAIINIKKSAGKSSSNDKEIYDYAVKDKELIKAQIDLIAPQIILCGYTAHALMKGVYEKNDYGKFYSTEFCIEHNEMLIIDFWHPSRKNGREIIFCNKLAKDYQKYLKIKEKL